MLFTLVKFWTKWIKNIKFYVIFGILFVPFSKYFVFWSIVFVPKAKFYVIRGSMWRKYVLKINCYVNYFNIEPPKTTHFRFFFTLFLRFSHFFHMNSCKTALFRNKNCSLLQFYLLLITKNVVFPQKPP